MNLRNLRKQFGGKVTKELVKQYADSPNWQNGSFKNLIDAEINPSLWKIPSILYKQLTNDKDSEPNQALPIIPFDQQAFLAPSEKAKIIWYGHSVVLMRIEGKTILIDPMLGPDTTPIAPKATKRFSENTLSLIDEFPEIDLVLLTHDHYDHLDFDSIQQLKSKVKQYFVAKGVKRHLVRWGVNANTINEMDWWDQLPLGEITIHFTPTQHFSGRGLTDRMKTLWGGWVFETAEEKIWFSGDGGYGSHFREIGRRLGPFDFAFMECGQYNDDWRPLHLFPDEAIQAAIDAGAKKVMPVHWAGFALSYQHSWMEPAEEFVKAAVDQKVDYVLPPLGKLFEIADQGIEKWWV